jgi:ABC-type sugar transport system permease subunit
MGRADRANRRFAHPYGDQKGGSAMSIVTILIIIILVLIALYLFRRVI